MNIVACVPIPKDTFSIKYHVVLIVYIMANAAWEWGWTLEASLVPGLSGNKYKELFSALVEISVMRTTTCDKL